MSRRVSPEQLKKKLEEQTRRMVQAEKDRPTLLAQTAFLGMLGVLFALPIVVGAYLGNWLDTRSEGYSMVWTMSLLVVGAISGFVNVYLFLRD
ncbi:MAG: AtpZ/AtpI family protein [Deltaproteobacteria bacterium]|nr:AtpZ/AtpI family protein [Deltaproteobacteria bacterium]